MTDFLSEEDIAKRRETAEKCDCHVCRSAVLPLIDNLALYRSLVIKLWDAPHVWGYDLEVGEIDDIRLANAGSHETVETKARLLTDEEAALLRSLVSDRRPG